MTEVNPDEWLVNKAQESNAPIFIFAHGAGIGMDSDFMEQMAVFLATRGVTTYRFEFPYMKIRRNIGGRRPPDRQPVLLEAWRNTIQQIRSLFPPSTPIFIGGKSMGGRMASLIADEVNVQGLVCLRYPFHPQGKPTSLRTEHLFTLKTQTLIAQGTRDRLGDKLEVASYSLPAVIDFFWLQDGDHDLKPRVRSGYTQKQHCLSAANAIASFIRDASN